MSRAGEIAIAVIVISIGLLVIGSGVYYTYLLIKSRIMAEGAIPEEFLGKLFLTNLSSSYRCGFRSYYVYDYEGPSDSSLWG
jgi:hypothetical protein